MKELKKKEQFAFGKMFVNDNNEDEGDYRNSK